MTQALVNPLNKDDQENHLHLSNNASHIKKGISTSIMLFRNYDVLYGRDQLEQNVRGATTKLPRRFED